jgi:hypothetical protein
MDPHTIAEAGIDKHLADLARKAARYLSEAWHHTFVLGGELVDVAQQIALSLGDG